MKNMPVFLAALGFLLIFISLLWGFALNAQGVLGVTLLALISVGCVFLAVAFVVWKIGESR